MQSLKETSVFGNFWVRETWHQSHENILCMFLSVYLTFTHSVHLHSPRIHTKQCYLSDAPVTTKLSKGHWNWYGSLKFNGHYLKANFKNNLIQLLQCFRFATIGQSGELSILHRLKKKKSNDNDSSVNKDQDKMQKSRDQHINTTQMHKLTKQGGKHSWHATGPYPTLREEILESKWSIANTKPGNKWSKKDLDYKFFFFFKHAASKMEHRGTARIFWKTK